MNLIIIIGVVFGLTILTNIAATPIHSSFDKASQYIEIIKEKIIVPPKTKIIYEPIITPDPIKNQIEKYPEIRNFLNNLPDCEWCIICGSYAHYTRVKAQKQDIPIHEITITIPQPKGTHPLTYFSEHRINFFYANDGHRVYIDNMYNWGIILEGYELKDHIKNKFNITPEKIGFKNQKL